MGRLTPPEIPAGSLVGIDTVAWIYLLERHPVHHGTAHAFFARLEAGEVRGVISTLVLAELLVPAYRDGDPERAAELVRVLERFPNLHIVGLDGAIAARAAELRARYGLRTPDAIHCATAIRSGCDVFLTNDAKLRSVSPELSVCLFEEETRPA